MPASRVRLRGGTGVELAFASVLPRGTRGNRESGERRAKNALKTRGTRFGNPGNRRRKSILQTDFPAKILARKYVLIECPFLSAKVHPESTMRKSTFGLYFFSVGLFIMGERRSLKDRFFQTDFPAKILARKYVLVESPFRKSTFECPF